MSEHRNETESRASEEPLLKGTSHKISRRGLLASIGAAGVVLAAGGIGRTSALPVSAAVGTVTASVYGGGGDGSTGVEHGIWNVREQGAHGDDVHDDTVAIQSAIDQCAAAGGGIVYLPPGVYKVTDTLMLHTGVTLEGAGVGAWDIPFPNRTKLPAASELRFTGTGAKTYSLTYATDLFPSGGVLTHTDTLPDHQDAVYSLTNFRLGDAAPGQAATVRPFSVAVYVPKGSQFAAIRHLRIVPNFDGLNGYNNKTTFALGDEWDVGLYLDNAQDIAVHNVQVVGYWRIAANLIGAGGLGTEYNNAGAERNRFYDCVFQGLTGVCVRGGDLYRSLAFGGTAGNYTLDIPWWSSSPLDAAGRIKFGSKTLDYTSTSVSGDRMTLYGLTIDPALQGKVGDEVRISPYSTGYAGSTYINCYIAGLEHASKRAASHNAIGLGVSKNIELSGTSLRGFKFISCTIQGHEDVLLHLHEAFDIQFIGSYFESGARYDGKLGGGRMIAAPWRNTTQARGPYPSGQTNNVYFLATECSSVDKAPKFKRQSSVRYTDTGFFNPRYMFDSYETMPQTSETDFLLKAPLSARTKLQNGEGKDALAVTPGANVEIFGAINQVSGPMVLESKNGHELRVQGDVKLRLAATGDAVLSANVLPMQDGTASLGEAAQRWKQLHVTEGIVMMTPDGSKTYRLSLNNDGTLRTELV
ncbi:MAG: mannuronan C-5-epimerase, multi-domain protein [Paenibacillus sp.]|uniref:glycosyl hydrolase family 28-related protein n=1 Tax=Paenibacillus sp. GCM10012303 TaxID=3317340 RepID=UPI0029F28DCD|nr:mannuronan C-5-epimerase, multi-domain protein [Paenibacillus sp.]